MSHEPATLLILAGGESKRMGFPKHQLTVDGRDTLTHLHERLGHLFVETIVVGRDLDSVPEDVCVAEDRLIARSPLVGIHGGLSASRTNLTFVVACDMPYVEPKLVEFLLSQAEGFDVVVPVVRGYYEPLCSAYRRTCLEPIERLITQGVLKVTTFYTHVRAHAIPETQFGQFDSELRSFANLNAPCHAERAIEPTI
ncbi:molybdenum cofactor guanylyltransferase [Candidatus Bipolaricaulota bacterium]